MKGRLLLGGIGFVGGAYGLWLLLSRQDRDQLFSAAEWLVAGVVLHDFVLTPLVLLLVAGSSPLLPRAYRAPAVAGLVVLGSVTLLAIPVLGSYGAQTHNTSLLDRNYVAGWLGLAAAVAVTVAAAGALRHRRSRNAEVPGRDSTV